LPLLFSASRFAWTSGFGFNLPLVASGCFALTVPAVGIDTTRCQPPAALLYVVRGPTVKESVFSVGVAAHVTGSKYDACAAAVGTMTSGPVPEPETVSVASDVPVSGASLIHAPVVLGGSFEVVKVPFWPVMPTFVTVAPGMPNAYPNCWMPFPVTMSTVYVPPFAL